METLAVLLQIAREAAELVMKIYETPFAVEYKGPSDPVTLADRLANNLICKRLATAFPGVPIVAEESPRAEWGDYQCADRIFFVDPVDGTREFVAKNGQFAVMIGLVEGQRPIAGVLHAPSSNHIWAGEVGRGAFFIDEHGTKQALAPLSNKALRDATIVGSKNDAARLSDVDVEHLAPHQHITMGSAALKAACVADGRADVYFAKKKAGCLWDTCAPEAILGALGGVFTDTRGRLLDYRDAEVAQNRGAVAAAPGLHAEILARVAALDF